MSFVLRLHTELTKNRATQTFAKLLIAMPWKRLLFAIALVCFAPSTNRAPMPASCRRNSEVFTAPSRQAKRARPRQNAGRSSAFSKQK